MKGTGIMTPVSNLTSVIAVLPVTDYDASIAWYTKWIGRRPDIEPADGVAEWQVAEQAWLQVSVDPESAGQTTVVFGVADLEAQCLHCAAAGVPWGEIDDYGFIKTAEAQDPAGNTITFVQEVQPAEADQPG